MGRDHFFKSAEEASAYCGSLLLAGDADLFRGQSNDWSAIVPSLFRGTEDVRVKARSLLDEFTEWANFVPQMAVYHKNDQAITAIAQHYGIPTPFLDLTTDPTIAELFARDVTGEGPPGNAVVYCFKRRDLERLEGFRVVEIDVLNLWRLQAQKGLFLEYGEGCHIDAVRDAAIRVHFPRHTITPAESALLYPLRKSVLETVIDQWAYRHQIQQLFSMFTVQKLLTVRRYTYPGIFRWRVVPDFPPDWVAYDPRWVFPGVEHVEQAIKSRNHIIEIRDASDVALAFSQLLTLFEGPVRAYAESGAPVGFEIRLPGHTSHEGYASVILNRCWDGIRAHPYSIKNGIRSMAATALALIRLTLHPELPDWEEQLWGQVEAIDVAPVGGHIDSGSVSKLALSEALHTNYHGRMTRYFKRRTGDIPKFLLDYAVDPWILFDFEKFSTMFVEQFIPSCVGWYWKESLDNNDGVPGDLWGASFNAALVATVTRFGWRFYSPVSAEKDVDHLILISKDMSEDEIEEIFISCLPSILKGGKPFIVKFTDYNSDERELWEIDGVVEQCRTINRVGGISVLDVAPGMRDADAPKPEWDPGGMGAIHVWAIANGRLAEINGVEFGKIRPIFEEFIRDLALSNANIERRGRAQPDWPRE